MRDVDPALFPNVVSALRRAGIDPERELVPVAPTAHYMMGGIATDLDGRATLPGLYAVGECSCTGLHGANRLASNSLTECFVFGARAACAAMQEPAPAGTIAPSGSPLRARAPSAKSREALWHYAGLERDGEGLGHLLGDPHPLVRLIGRSALAREESRGAHVRRDFPALDRALDGRHVMVSEGAGPTLQEWP
jgi:L-aspartate oxidase